MHKAVVFDFYGVLGLNGWQAFKAEHFADRDEEWQKLRALGQRVDAGKSSEEEFVTAVAHATHESDAVVRQQFEQTRPNKQLLDFIGSELVGKCKLAVLSNASRDVFADVMTTEQLSYFDVLLSSFHIGLVKPDPAIFRFAADRLTVPLSSCLMVDDRKEHLDAAAGVGMTPILYTSVHQTVQDVLGCIVPDVS